MLFFQGVTVNFLLPSPAPLANAVGRCGVPTRRCFALLKAALGSCLALLGAVLWGQPHLPGPAGVPGLR